MADGTGDLEIRVGIDPAGADAGAAAATGDVDRVARKTVDANAQIAASAQTTASAEDSQAASVDRVTARLQRLNTMAETWGGGTLPAVTQATSAAEGAALRYSSAVDRTTEGALRAQAATGSVTRRLEELGQVGPQALQDTNYAMSQYVVGAEAAEGATAMTTEEAEAMSVALREQQNNLMRNAFYVHRLAEGFKDMSMGGRLASQGLMDISETAQYALGPQYAMYAAGVQVIAMLAMMATMHRGRGEAAREGAEKAEKAEQEVKEAIDKGTESLIHQREEVAKTHLEVLTQNLREFIDAQKELFAQQKEWDEHAQKRLDWIQQETEAQQKLTLVQMENAKQQELAGAHGQAERDVIEARYAAQELSVKGGNADEQYQAKLKGLDLQKKNDDSERQQLVANNQDLLSQLQGLKDDAAAKTRKVEAEGFNPDEAGLFDNAIKNLAGALKLAREDAVAKSDAADDAAMSHRLSVNLPGLLGNVARSAVSDAQEKSQQAQELVTSITGKLQDLTDAQSAREALKDQGKTLEDAIKANSTAIDKLVFQLEEITHSRNLADTAHTTAKTEETTEGTKEQEEADKKAAKDAFDVREALRYAQEKEQQRVLDNPNATDEQKAQAKAAQDQVEAQSKQDQLDHASALELTLAEIIRLRADLGLDTSKAADALAAGQKKGGKADDKALSDEARQMEQAITGSHDSNAIAQMGVIIRSAANDKQELVKLLQAVLDTMGVSATTLEQHKSAIHDLGTRMRHAEAR